MKNYSRYLNTNKLNSLILNRSLLMIYLFFTLMLLKENSIQAANLHAIFVCDTIANNISTAVLNDLRMMKEEAHRISWNTDLTLREEIITGYDLQPEEVFAKLESLQIEPEDRILFYFSGHGYRTPSKEGNPWPNLYFTPVAKGIDFDEVFQLLKEKNPGFLLAIADCCNNVLPDHSAPAVYHRDLELISEKVTSKIAAGYRKLFLENKGSIVISSSIPGEYSWCYQKGALFTLAFIAGLKNTTERDYPTWQKILNLASATVSDFQTTQYVMELD